MIKLVMFDLDGVLTDTSDIHAEAFIIALNGMNYNLSKEEYHKYGTVSSHTRLLKLSMENKIDKKDIDAIYKVKQEVTKDMIRSLDVDQELIDALTLIKKSMKFGQIAVCSNANTEFVQKVLFKIGVLDLMDSIIGSTSGIVGKPSPDMYKWTMKKLDTNPENSLIIEDSPTGIVAGYAANVNVFRVKNPSDLKDSINDIIDIIKWSIYHES